MSDESTPNPKEDANGDGASRRDPLDLLASACMGAAGAMLVTLILIFGWLVWGRYVMNDTPTWVEQVSLILVVWITFLGAAVAVHQRAHLAVDFIRDAFPDRLRRAATVLADLMVLGFAAAMVWHGYLLTEAGTARDVPMLGVSEAWRVAAVPVSGALITLFISVRLLRGVFGKGG